MKNKKAENKSQRPLGMPAGGICNGRWELSVVKWLRP